MKLRQGFVSNSSSSSFILNINDHGTLSEISRDMLDVVIEDFEDTGKQQQKKESKLHKGWRKSLAKALRMKGVKEGNIGIVFPSCNYETYIIQKGDSLYIATSNNHKFNFEGTVTNYDYSDSDESKKLYDLTRESMYFDVSRGFVHSYEKYDINKKDNSILCPQCKHAPYSYVTTPEHIRICGDCFKGELGKTPEKEIEELKEEKSKHIHLTDYLEPE